MVYIGFCINGTFAFDGVALSAQIFIGGFLEAI